jgi:hypothetical protein
VKNRLKVMIDANLPVIGVFTRDTINFPDVIERLVGKKPQLWGAKSKPIGGGLYYNIIDFGLKIQQMPDLDKLYKAMLGLQATILVVNPPEIYDPMFAGGEVPTPKEMLIEAMVSVVGDPKKANSLCTALGGVTLKEAVELASITMARDASLTAQGIVDTRRTYFQGQQGLTLVASHQNFYEPHQALAAYIKAEKASFLHETDPRLIPRGLLMTGPPGVGKTAGAKYIAEQWGVPLYRFDVATTQSKWVGESEANVATNLTRLDYEEPCVVLFDEIEKIFQQKQHDDGAGVSTRLLSQLLWWLAERTSRVFVVMTTNDITAIPPELYRERRIDQALGFEALFKGPAVKFVEHLLDTFPGVVTLKTASADAIVKDVLIKTSKTTVSQAALTEATFKFIKTLKAAPAK